MVEARVEDYDIAIVAVITSTLALLPRNMSIEEMT